MNQAHESTDSVSQALTLEKIAARYRLESELLTLNQELDDLNISLSEQRSKNARISVQHETVTQESQPAETNPFIVKHIPKSDADPYILSPPKTYATRNIFREITNIKGELLSAEEGKCPRTIMVTSSLEKEGKTTTAIVIARSLAKESHDKVLLIDASTGRHSFEGLYKLDNMKPGLLELVAHKASLADGIVHKSDYKHLDLMSFGKFFHSEIRSFDAKQFSLLLESLKQHYDFIIVDAPSFLSSSSAAMMVSAFDGAIVVVRCKKTRKQIIQQVMNKIEMLGGNVIGTVLNYRSFYIPGWMYKWI